MHLLGMLLVAAATILFVIVASRLVNRIEEFGMSPGTLTQLQSTHVPTRYDLETEIAMQKEMEKDSIELTGSL
jgi:hypothetical protein